jgi:hypothetical protein
MTYLPLLPAEETEFPRAQTRDLRMQIKIIEEQYTRFYPATEYFPLLKQTTPVTSTATGDRTPSGAAGTTKFDSIYGEMMPTGATEWQQPHGTAGTVPATELSVFDVPVILHSRRQRINKETDLKKYGFDKQRDLLITIPASLLDAAGITVTHGDKFIWNGTEFIVQDHNRQGYWKNTDIALYVVINANQYRKGS